MSAIATMAPAELEGTLMDLLREHAGAGMTARQAAVAFHRRHTPASSVPEVQEVLVATLHDLLHSGRVEAAWSPRGAMTWRAACFNDAVERRILNLQAALGGRPVEATGARWTDDPHVTVTAPLSLLERYVGADVAVAP